MRQYKDTRAQRLRESPTLTEYSRRSEAALLERSFSHAGHRGIVSHFSASRLDPLSLVNLSWQTYAWRVLLGRWQLAPRRSCHGPPCGIWRPTAHGPFYLLYAALTCLVHTQETRMEENFFSFLVDHKYVPYTYHCSCVNSPR